MRLCEFLCAFLVCCSYEFLQWSLPFQFQVLTCTDFQPSFWETYNKCFCLEFSGGSEHGYRSMLHNCTSGQTSRREMRAHWVVCEWTLVVHPQLWLLSSWSWMFLVQSLYPFTPEYWSLHFISFLLKATQGPSIPDALKNYSWYIFGRDYVPETSTSYQGSRHKVHRDLRLLLGRYILNLSLVHQLLWFFLWLTVWSYVSLKIHTA